MLLFRPTTNVDTIPIEPKNSQFLPLARDRSSMELLKSTMAGVNLHALQDTKIELTLVSKSQYRD